MSHKNTFYPEEVKLEAVRLRLEGYSVREIQELLGIKSESQVYTWWYWYQNGEEHKFLNLLENNIVMVMVLRKVLNMNPSKEESKC